MSKLTQNKTQLKDIFTGPVMKPLFVSRPGSDVIPENDRRQRNYISHRQHCQFNIRQSDRAPLLSPACSRGFSNRGVLTGKLFTIKYHHDADALEFGQNLVLRQNYDLSLQRNCSVMVTASAAYFITSDMKASWKTIECQVSNMQYLTSGQIFKNKQEAVE